MKATSPACFMQQTIYLLTNRNVSRRYNMDWFSIPLAVFSFFFLLITVSESSEQCGYNTPLRCPYNQQCFKYQKKSECGPIDGSENRPRSKQDADYVGKCPRAPTRHICLDVAKVCKEVSLYKERSVAGKNPGYPAEVPYTAGADTNKGGSRNGDDSKRTDSQESIISDMCHGPLESYQPSNKGTNARAFCNDGGCNRHEDCKVRMPGDIVICCEGSCAHVSNLQRIKPVFDRKDQICPE
ncbi:hypothetical protein RvY_12479-2 [Ramazzottius varieornatus]|uniref:Uncharacterized protein n=1 Tax=Ramazzottius varieornatus TaxID=947166 RepID=A0A1D1VJM8_RAMVA|nr:hypothetical protein RvY_12479-2 [Ramazzottius varieornatus]